jgi:hypothetical protein
MRIVIVAAALLGITAGVAGAEGSAGSKKVGLGIVVGQPTGISFKLNLNAENAIDAAAAWSLSGNNNLHLRADYIYHRYGVIDVDKGRLPLFFGVGGRIELRENARNLFGIRFPIGLDYYFSGAPFDVFVQVAPVLEVAPDTDFEFEAALGGRFWF